jgi:hypothetical protein
MHLTTDFYTIKTQYFTMSHDFIVPVIFLITSYIQLIQNLS